MFVYCLCTNTNSFLKTPDLNVESLSLKIKAIKFTLSFLNLCLHLKGWRTSCSAPGPIITVCFQDTIAYNLVYLYCIQAACRDMRCWLWTLELSK